VSGMFGFSREEFEFVTERWAIDLENAATFLVFF